MKIAYVSTYLPVRCGIATYTDYLIQGIKEVDETAEITVVAERGAHPIVNDGFLVDPCWDRDEDYVDPIISRTVGADIIHIQHEYSIYKFDDRLPSVLQKLDPKAKKLVTIHCIRPAQFSERGPLDERFAARIANLADDVIVHLGSQRAILTRLGIPPEKIHLIPHGSELTDEGMENSRRRLGLPRKAKILLMFGYIKKHKCLHIALKALSHVLERFPDTYLFIAGGLHPAAKKRDIEYVDYVEKRIEKLGLKERVIFPKRFFPNEDVPYLLGASDIVLFPYYEEDRSVSGSLHLAIGSKKPIIASRIPKFEELKNICEGLLVLPYNYNGMARIAIRLFEEPEFRDYVLGRVDEYRKSTSWKVIGRKHLKLYSC